MRAHALTVSIMLAVGSLGGLSCDADLEPGCIDGECTSSNTGPGAGGGTGECTGDQHDLPCGVYDILSGICQQCHIPGGQGPFKLQEYCDTQDIYGSRPIWSRMRDTIKVDAFPRMPLGQDPLSDSQMATLNAWFDTCGGETDVGVCVGAQNGPPPTCGQGGAGGAAAGGAPAGGAPAGGNGGAGGI